MRTSNPFIFVHIAILRQQISAMSFAQMESYAWVEDSWHSWQRKFAEGRKAQKASSSSWQEVAEGDIQDEETIEEKDWSLYFWGGEDLQKKGPMNWTQEAKAWTILGRFG